MLVRFWRNPHNQEDYVDFPFPQAPLSVIEDYIESIYPNVDWDTISYSPLIDNVKPARPYKLVTHLTRDGDPPAYVTEEPYIPAGIVKYCMNDANASQWMDWREITVWYIYCQTGCSCCSSDNHYRGFFPTKEEAQKQVDIWLDPSVSTWADPMKHDLPPVASQYARRGRYTIEETTIELIPKNRVIVGSSCQIFEPATRIAKIEDLLVTFDENGVKQGTITVVDNY